ncbi:MAG: prolyl oligopeptidase family serine peptidase [Mucilaginibacter polytrichastri]|nr:prolyl oligopeptidase family serine peptidase [Mucilaginibacter polytrichastri]
MFNRSAFLTVAIILASTFIGVLIGVKGHAAFHKAISYIPLDDTRIFAWDRSLSDVEIPSKKDKEIQHAYFYSARKPNRPLLVSLHTWNGNYKQKDEFAKLAKERNWNYIHPDFRGPNNRMEACSSDLVISDIDDAISYALKKGMADETKIYVIGGSGGGFAAAAVLMRSRHQLASVSAWCPITDIPAWFRQTSLRHLDYAEDILKCTGSKDSILNMPTARHRSPIFWPLPESRSNTKINLYAGIHDGIQGSVPISQSINFYNKLLKDAGCDVPAAFISNDERVMLSENQIQPTAAKIGDRPLLLQKQFKNISLAIFEGNHEILHSTAISLIEATPVKSGTKF